MRGDALVCDFLRRPSSACRHLLPVKNGEKRIGGAASAPKSSATALLPDARFAPVIPGWEEIAQITYDAMQKIYLGKPEEIEATLKDAAAKADAILKK